MAISRSLPSTTNVPQGIDPLSRVAFLFPGQGAQAVGMGQQLAKLLPAARALMDRAGEILGYDLAKLCYEGPADQLNTTIHSQPALYVTSLMALEQDKQEKAELVEKLAQFTLDGKCEN